MVQSTAKEGIAMQTRTYSPVRRFALPLLGLFLTALPALGESLTYTFTTVDFPNGGSTLYGLNNAGLIVGSSKCEFWLLYTRHPRLGRQRYRCLARLRPKLGCRDQ